MSLLKKIDKVELTEEEQEAQRLSLRTIDLYITIVLKLTIITFILIITAFKL